MDPAFFNHPLIWFPPICAALYVVHQSHQKRLIGPLWQRRLNNLATTMPPLDRPAYQRLRQKFAARADSGALSLVLPDAEDGALSRVDQECGTLETTEPPTATKPTPGPDEPTP